MKKNAQKRRENQGDGGQYSANYFEELMYTGCEQKHKRKDKLRNMS